MTFDWLDADFDLASAALTVLLVAHLLIAGHVVAIQRFARLRAERLTDPTALSRYYRRLLAGAWIIFGWVVAVVVLDPGVSARSIGVRAPAGDGLDYLVTAVLLASLVNGGLRARRRLRRGRGTPAREAVAALLPRTRSERWLAVAVSVTAGIVEETVYRGLLITAGVGLLRLSPYVAAALVLALFVWGHQYQGRRNLFPVALTSLIQTMVYLLSGSLLLPMVLHIAQNIVALVLVPAEPSPVLSEVDGRGGSRGVVSTVPGPGTPELCEENRSTRC